MPATTSAPAAQRVGVREFRQNLPGYLRQVRVGATLLITSHDEVVAELRPPPAALRPRREPGSMRGEIQVAEDFNDLPDDILDAMEGRRD